MAINLSGMISGLAERTHEHQLLDWQDEKQRRRDYLDHLTKIMESTPYDSTYQHASQEIADTLALGMDKRVKPKPIPVPDELKTDASVRGGQRPPGTGASPQPPAAGSQASPSMGMGDGTTPPPLDLGDLLRSAHAAAGDAGSGSGGGSPASATTPQPVAIPWHMAGMGGMASDDASPAAAAMPTMPPGHRSLPEPYAVPGQPPTTAPQLPQPPGQPLEQSGMTPQPIGATPAPLPAIGHPPAIGQPPGGEVLSANPNSLSAAHRRGEAKVAEMQPLTEYYLAHNLGPTGKPRVDATKMAAMGKIYDPQSPDADAFGYRPATSAELPLPMRAKAEKDLATRDLDNTRAMLDEHHAAYYDAVARARTQGTPLAWAQVRNEAERTTVMAAKEAREHRESLIKYPEDIAGGNGVILSQPAQKTAGEIYPRIQQIDRILAAYEPFKSENMPFSQLWQRGLYYAGIASEDDLGKQIASLELSRIQSAASVLKGSSRAYPIFLKALVHTPNGRDSPAQVYHKLSMLRQNLSDMYDDTLRFGNKFGVTRLPADPSAGRTDTAPTPAKILDEKTATDFYLQAGRNKEAARALAIKAGYSVPNQ